MIRAFRDAYNRTNLTLSVGSFRIEASAADEPWSSPTLALLVHVRRRFVRWSLTWN